MRIFCALAILLFSYDASASAIPLRPILEFADEHSYKDNRKFIRRDRMYSASKGCCSVDVPYSILEAFRGTQSFTQVALSCDHCGIEQMSEDQVQLCRTEFHHLYKKLFSADLGDDLVKNMVVAEAGTSKVVSSKAAKKIRFSSQALKCDGKGGIRFRVDIFSK